MSQFKQGLAAASVACVMIMAVSPADAQTFDDCGFLKCCGGILVLESDAGTIYELIDPDIHYTPGTRARVVGDEDLTCEPSCLYATACINNGVISPCFATNAHSSTGLTEDGDVPIMGSLVPTITFQEDKSWV